MDAIVTAGESITYEPRFTVHGYRYAELSGLPAGFRPDATTVTGRAVWTDARQPGSFSASEPLLNKLQHNIVWGERSNMLSIEVSMHALGAYSNA